MNKFSRLITLIKNSTWPIFDKNLNSKSVSIYFNEQTTDAQILHTTITAFLNGYILSLSIQIQKIKNPLEPEITCVYDGILNPEHPDIARTHRLYKKQLKKLGARDSLLCIKDEALTVEKIAGHIALSVAQRAREEKKCLYSEQIQEQLKKIIIPSLAQDKNLLNILAPLEIAHTQRKLDSVIPRTIMSAKRNKV